MEIVFTENAPKAIGPYSQAVIAGNLVFTSGQIAIDPKSSLIVDGGIEKQIVQVMNNLKAVVEKSGSSMEKIIKTTIFLKNMADFSVVNEVYGSYFNNKFPARSCVEVARLPKDVLVEIEAIAEI